MHQAANYVAGTVLAGIRAGLIQQRHLNTNEARILQKHLADDAVCYYYSAIITLCDAVRGIMSKYYTWSAVKLYYVVFYAIKSLLAVDGICIFYDKNTPYSLFSVAGAAPKKGKGNSHNFVLGRYKDEFSNSLLLSQSIGMDEPFDWIQNIRDDANYGHAKFCEPNIPKHFNAIVKTAMATMLRAYITDANAQYAFDPDHAMFAYPIIVLKHADKRISSMKNYKCPREDLRYITSLFKRLSIAPISAFSFLK